MKNASYKWRKFHFLVCKTKIWRFVQNYAKLEAIFAHFHALQFIKN